MNEYIINHIQNSINVKNKILENKEILNNILMSSKICVEAYKKKKKIIIAGNGGSATGAQHIVAELVGKFSFDRPALFAIDLTSNTSILTALANDYGYNKIFSRQIQASGCEGDVFIAISTSGNSKNIIEALTECKKQNITTIGFTGNKESDMDKLANICIKVPSLSTPEIQESHIMIGHILCDIIEKSLFGKNF